MRGRESGGAGRGRSSSALGLERVEFLLPATGSHGLLEAVLVTLKIMIMVVTIRRV